jgi:hypothetical protein
MIPPSTLVYQRYTSAMADTTTVKVHTSTRDLILQLGAVDGRLPTRSFGPLSRP